MTRPRLISAIPTIFRENGEFDADGTRAALEHALAGGVDALFVDGTTGEFPALDRDERATIARMALDVAGPERTIVHVGGSSAWEAVLLTQDAVAAGVGTIAAITPYYLPASTAAVRDYFTAIRDAAPGAEIFAYLFPDRTAVHVGVEEAAQLVRDLGLSGAKVSIAGTDYVQDLVEALGGSVAVYSGNDGLIAEVAAAGGAGVVSGVSSALPWPFVATADALGGGESPGDELRELTQAAVGILGPSIANLKYALLAQGVIDHATCRMAIDLPDAAVRSRIDDLVARAEGLRAGLGAG